MFWAEDQTARTALQTVSASALSECTATSLLSASTPFQWAATCGCGERRRVACRNEGRGDDDMSVRKYTSRWLCVIAVSLALGALAVLPAGTAAATTAVATTLSPAQPDFGPNVFVFNPGMPQSQIQATVDSVASQQV